MPGQSFTIGLLLFPRLTQLDLTGPFEVFKRMPGATVHLIWKNLDPIRADSGLGLLPTTTMAGCPSLDVICVPGGPGVAEIMEDEDVLAFLREKAATAQYVTSVCTGSLVLGAAGLLKGKRATSHWMSRDLLKSFGAVPVAERVVTDGNVITGGGVTAGIDFGLAIAGAAFGRKVAEEIQLSRQACGSRRSWSSTHSSRAGCASTTCATSSRSSRRRPWIRRTRFRSSRTCR
jgi:cyclohexyl-isocyanide hydratase